MENIELHPIEMKKCTMCLKTKPSTDYYKVYKNKNKRAAHCKECAHVKNTEFINKNKEHNKDNKIPENYEKECYKCKKIKNQKHFNRRLASPDGLVYACRECERIRVRGAATLEKHIKLLLKDCKGALSRRKIEIDDDIDVNFIAKLYNKQNGICPYSGIKMTYIRSNRTEKDFRTNFSIDRIDSTKGYIKNNIQLVCQWINIAKSDMPNELFEEFLGNVVKYRAEKENIVIIDKLKNFEASSEYSRGDMLWRTRVSF